MASSPAPRHEPNIGTGRIETFSDGVFAIAITLLILEIGVPKLSGDQSLGDALTGLWPDYFAYVLSFVMIGIYWANHHFVCRLFARSDHFFLMLNVFFLMCIAFVPFPTAVLGEYLRESDERQAAVAFYAFGLLLPAIGWLGFWLYANARRLLDQRLAPAYVRFLTLQYLLSLIPYTVAFAVSFASAWTALGICVGFTALYLLPPRRAQYVE